MTRRAPDGDRDSDPELLDARVRVKRINVHQLIRTVYSVSAILLWGGAAFASWRIGPSAVGAAVSLTQAITRASIALEHATEGTARIEAGQARIESKIDRLSDACARSCDGHAR